MFNAFFERVGIDAVVVPMEVSERNYPSFLRVLFQAENVRGALVTVPHKRATVDLLDDYSMAVRIAGACNAIVRRPDGTLYGELFDGAGFVRGLERWGFNPSGARCLIVGSGGVGAAMAAALAGAKAKSICLSDISVSSAESLASRLKQHFDAVDVLVGSNDPAGYDLVVNGSPLGMRSDDPLPVDVRRLAPATLVADAVMKQDITPLLREASARGCKIQLGREMLFEQAPLYLDFFGLGSYSSDELRPEV